MEPLRNTRLNAVKQLVGRHYSDSAAQDRVPINLIELASTIYSRNLIAQRPQVLVSTYQPGFKPASALLELAINHQLKKMKFGRLLRRVTMEALFGIGVVKAGRDADGALFADRVDVDNYYVDMRASGRENIQWEGDRYCMLLSDAVDRYGPKVKRYSRHLKTPYNETGDARASSVGGIDTATTENAIDDIELIDIYVPSERKVYTFPAPASGVAEGSDWTEPLDVVDWDGPENGPYHVLGFSDVPGNVLPVPPAALWMDLHELANGLFRKLGRQAERQKDLTLVQAGGEEDAIRVRDAADGEIVPLQNLQGMQQVSFGGADQISLAFLLQVKDMFSWLGGNLDALGGLSAQSQTATQDSLLHESASKRIAAMQGDLMEFTSDLVRDLAWWMWNDDSLELDLVRSIGALNIQIPVQWTADHRKGDFLDYTFDIEPYSFQALTPGAKTQALLSLWNQVMLPGAELGMQQGIAPNMDGMLRTLSKLMNLPEVEDVVTFVEPQAVPGMPSAGKAGDIAPDGAAEKRYIRENVPTGGTPQGRTAVAMQQLMGGNVQPDQAASNALGATPARY